MDLKGRHLLKLLDFTPEEILYLVDHADELKAKGCDAYYFPSFEGKEETGNSDFESPWKEYCSDF